MSRPIQNIVDDIVIDEDNKGYLGFIEQHKAQLNSNNIPENNWKSLFFKLKGQIFDAGNVFSMFHIEYGEHSDNAPLYKVVVSADSIDPDNGNHIYLIDHAWTYRASEAKIHLSEVPGLLERMAKLIGVSVESESIYDDVCKTMWKFNLTYSCSAMTNLEDQLPVWYIMDEFGSAIQHSNNPTFRIVPFLYIPEGAVYSLLMPLRIVSMDEEVTRDYVEGCTDETERKSRLLPWFPVSLQDIEYSQSEPPEEYFLSSRTNETLPNLSALIPKDTNGSIYEDEPFNVYSQYSYIKQYLTNPRFKHVEEEYDADILWLTSHFKYFKDFSELYPSRFINQFPFEYVITVKDLLGIICRRALDGEGNYDTETLETVPLWLPTTYNLNTELPKFVSYFQKRKERGLDNHWICKPWNLARGMDTLITNNLDCIIRLSSSGPKIAQKYIHNPVLFHRTGIGKVKFDIRYVILLKSVHPLEAYAYTNFFLRFANKQFDLHDLDDYEKHFTVMNYNNNTPLHRMLCADFVKEFDHQYPDNTWSSIEPKIFSMLYKMFEASTAKIPPCGIGESPQSRALYAADLMLETSSKGEFEPKLLEVNWAPDCQRACEYYPDFYNDIFSLLFLDTDKEVFQILV